MSAARRLGMLVLLALMTGGAAADASRATAAMGTIAFHSSISISGETSGPFIDDIYTVAADGTRLRNLTRNGRRVHDSSPAWSPDGTQIAFIRRTNGLRDAVFVMSSDGSRMQKLRSYPGGRALVALSWSPDGERIAFVRNESIWVVNADGTAPRPLIRNAGHPAWSPDGSKIAFVRALHDDDSSSTEIFVADANGTRQRRLTRNAYSEWSPAWSPDGRRIAFARYGGTRPGLFVMRQNGTAVRRLVRVNWTWPYCFTWSPDGRSIAFCSGGIAVVGAGGGSSRWVVVRPPLAVESVAWSPID